MREGEADGATIPKVLHGYIPTQPFLQRARAAQRFRSDEPARQHHGVRRGALEEATTLSAEESDRRRTLLERLAC